MSVDPNIYRPQDVPEDAEERAHWRVDGPKSASWALRKLAGIRKDKAKIQALYEAEREQLDAWRDQQLERHTSDESFFSSVLINWHMEQLDADPEAKTIKLPGGSLVARKSPPSWQVEADAFLEWAKENHPEWVRTKTEAAVSEIKKAAKPSTDPKNPVAYDENGEAIPGVRVLPGDVSYKIETNK